MKLFTIVFVAALTGIALGYAATVGEFGVSPPQPRLTEGYKKVAATTSERPQVVVDVPEHDFGFMLQKEKGSHTFVLRNEGTGTLVLDKKRSKSSCKCTVGEISRTRIAPGESTNVIVNWTANKASPDFRQNVQIHTNDPAQKFVRLSIRGAVMSDFRFDPAAAFVRGLTPTDTSENEVTLYFYKNKEMKIVDHRFMTPETAQMFDVAVEAIPEDQLEDKHALCGYRVKTTVKEGVPLGPVSQSVVFDTSAGTSTPVLLQYLGEVSPEVAIIGRGWDKASRTLTMGTVKASAGHLQHFSLLLNGKHRKDVQVTVKEVEPADLKVSLGDPFDWQRGTIVKVPVTVEIDAGAAPGAYEGPEKEKLGRIVLETTHPNWPELRLLVNLVITE